MDNETAMTPKLIERALRALVSSIAVFIVILTNIAIIPVIIPAIAPITIPAATIDDTS